MTSTESMVLSKSVNRTTPEKPISQVTPVSPYIHLGFNEMTGTLLTSVQSNLSVGAYALNQATGVVWGTSPYCTPDTTADTYVDDPDFDSDDDTDESPLESIMRLDDDFGTMFIAFTVKASSAVAPTDHSYIVSMGDSTVSGNPRIWVQLVNGNNRNVQLNINDGAVAAVTQSISGSYVFTERTTMLFAINKATNLMQCYTHGESGAVDSDSIAALDLSKIVPAVSATRPVGIFSLTWAGGHIKVVNRQTGLVMSFNSMLFFKSQADLTSSLQTICNDLHAYNGDLPWSLDGI